MELSPKISIITPVWNGLPFIEECVTSVLNQDFQDWELIISDNGSYDGTREYLDTLADPRIRVIKQEKNIGIIKNVNFIFSQARAPISQLLCADDYFIKPTAITEILKYWESASPEIGFVKFNHRAQDIKMAMGKKQGLPSIIYPAEADLWSFTFGCIPKNLSDVSIRTALVAEMGEFNYHLPAAGDFEFWIRAARKVVMGLSEENVVHVRKHEKVASHYQNLKGELFLQHIIIYENLIEELSSSHPHKSLVNFFNYEIATFHYRNAIKAAAHGNFKYLKQMLSARSPIVWPVWKQLLICFPVALLNIRESITDYMAMKLIDNQLHPNKKRAKLNFQFSN